MKAKKMLTVRWPNCLEIWQDGELVEAYEPRPGGELVVKVQIRRLNDGQAICDEGHVLASTQGAIH